MEDFGDAKDGISLKHIQDDIKIRMGFIEANKLSVGHIERYMCDALGVGYLKFRPRKVSRRVSKRKTERYLENK